MKCFNISIVDLNWELSIQDGGFVGLGLGKFNTSVNFYVCHFYLKSEQVLPL